MLEDTNSLDAAHMLLAFHDVLRLKLRRVTKVTVESKSSKVQSRYAARKIH